MCSNGPFTLSVVSYISRDSWGWIGYIMVWMSYPFVFNITLFHYHHHDHADICGCIELINTGTSVRYILSSVCPGLSQCSQLSSMQYMGGCVFSRPSQLFLQLIKTDGGTDRQTDGRTDRQTDRPTNQPTRRMNILPSPFGEESENIILRIHWQNGQYSAWQS